MGFTVDGAVYTPFQGSEYGSCSSHDSYEQKVYCFLFCQEIQSGMEQQQKNTVLYLEKIPIKGQSF